MNLKKFISGVSALTIAASAFAAMAVTASAAEYSGSFVQSASQVAGGIKRQWNYTKGQTEMNAGNNEAGQPYAGYAYVRMSLPEIPETEAFDSAEFSVNIKFASNSGNRSAVLKVADGLVINEDVADGVYSYGGEWETAPVNSWDGGGVTFSDAIADTTFVRGENTAPTSYTAWTNDVSEAVAAAYEAGQTEITFAIYGKRSVSSAYPSVSTDGAALTVTSTVKGAAEAVVVNYTYNDSVVASDAAIDISESGLIEGNDYTFYLPAYVESEGAIYTTGLTNFAKTVKVAEGTTTVDVPVTLVTDGVYQFNEPAGTKKQYNNREAQTSRGTIANVGELLTVANDGIYSVKVVVGSTEGTARIGGLYVNETTDDNKIASVTYAGNVSTINLTDVTLKAGDKLILAGGNSKSSVDYVLIQKTGELPEEPVVPVVEKSVENSAVFTVADGYDADVVVGTIQLDVSEAAIDLTAATYEGNAPTDVTGDNVTAFQGSALITVIINGATSADALSQVVFN